PVSTVIRTLKYADAGELSDQIKKMLDDGKKVTSRAGTTTAQPGVAEGAAGLAYAAVVTPDSRTNSIFIAGTPESVKLITDYIDTVDQIGVELMPVEMIQLRNASADDLAKVISDTMKDRQSNLPRGTSGGGGGSTTNR